MAPVHSQQWLSVTECSDSSDEEFFDNLTDQALHILTMNEMATTERNFKWPDTRLNWNGHVEKLIHRDEFEHIPYVACSFPETTPTRNSPSSDIC